MTTLPRYKVVKRRVAELKPRQHHPAGTCARCAETQPIAARGLCDACYAACKNNDTLLDYPRRRRPLTEVIEDYQHLHAAGETDERIATRLGFKQVSYLKGLVKRAKEQCLLPDGAR